MLSDGFLRTLEPSWSLPNTQVKLYLLTMLRTLVESPDGSSDEMKLHRLKAEVSSAVGCLRLFD